MFKHRSITRCGAAFLLALSTAPLTGCAVVSVADAAVTVVATTVKVTAKTVGAAVDMALPDGDKDDKD